MEDKDVDVFWKRILELAPKVFKLPKKYFIDFKENDAYEKEKELMEHYREWCKKIREDMTKNDYLDVMEYIIKKARKSPFVCIVFMVNAKNEDIEEYQMKTAGRNADADLTKEELIQKGKEDYEEFKKSKRYNPEGNSNVLFSMISTVEEINMKKLMEISEKPPFGKFVKFILDKNELMEDEEEIKNFI